MFAPIVTGGDDITLYELYIDEGVENSDFNLVESYDGISLTHTVDKETDSLTEGLVYSFKFRSRNRVGFSDFTDVVRVALANQVAAP
jgi:hypothetical protein